MAADHPDALPLIEAAGRLGLSENALRIRIRRGLVAAHKRDGRWYVIVPDQVDQSADESRDQSDSGDDRSTTSQATSQDRTDELIAAQRNEIEFLREQLDQRSRELAAERERADILHREALGQIQALTAGDDDHDVDQDESAQDQRTAPTMPSGREEPSVMTPDTSHEPSVVTSWLRRLVGRS